LIEEGLGGFFVQAGIIGPLKCCRPVLSGIKRYLAVFGGIKREPNAG